MRNYAHGMEEQPMTADAGERSNQPDFDLVVRGERTLTTAGIVAREIGIRDGRVVAIEPLGSGLAPACPNGASCPSPASCCARASPTWCGFPMPG